ncbi:hypothetical protein QN277_022194 [Acacia crassicarpa]|uniref:NAC domain-containing protein n=1 Tax=Acacia crassicarpa TaxID=499986 RepID=A0AAE1JIL2_9FABA|nr:hypothetical protein QN277_022194 [Acacia crassicarpa]
MANVAPELESRIVGFGFRPTDVELVKHYLNKKLSGQDPVLQIIPVIELCKHEPGDIPGLPELSIIKSDDPQWFFFSPPDYKYKKNSNSKLSNRSTNSGFWKPTGKDRDIKVQGVKIGTKKTLVFFVRRGLVSTNWVIHEYHAFPEDQRAFVLCKLMKKHKKAKGRTGEKGDPNNFMPSDDYESVPSEGRIPDANVCPENNLDEMLQTQQSADEYEMRLLVLSPNVNEQELSSLFPPGFNSHTRNDDSIANVPPKFTEEEVNFGNSLLVDDEDELY